MAFIHFLPGNYGNPLHSFSLLVVPLNLPHLIFRHLPLERSSTDWVLRIRPWQLASANMSSIGHQKLRKGRAYIVARGRGRDCSDLRHRPVVSHERESTNSEDIISDKAAGNPGQNAHHMLEGHLKGVTNSTRSTVNMERILERTNSKPRYLFRAYSSKSRGLNSEGLFKSQAAKEGRYLNVESLTKDEMAKHLENHIGNKNYESHFISFSLSFLWVLHKALSLKEQRHQDVRVAMLDTWDIPRNTWVRHADSMLKGYGIDAKLRLENLGAAELLVWDELQVPLSEAKLNDMLEAGVLKLLPFYKAPENLDIVTDSPMMTRKKSISRYRKPCVIRSMIFKHLTDAKAFVQELHQRMAPNYYRETYVAGRSFYNKKFSRWWLQQRYTPLSKPKMLSFVKFVETFFITKYQFPMLVTMLSMRLDEIDPTDVIESMFTLRDRPMMLGQNQCFKGKNRRGLKELDSFEWLLEQCAEALGIPCRTFENWHETRFTMPQALAVVSQPPSPTYGWQKNFEGKLKLNLREDRKDASAEEGLVLAKDLTQLPGAGKRKAESELERDIVRKCGSTQSSQAEEEAFVQKFLGRMCKIG
ncbi:uncharacterized protein A1O9_11440 [Exophiala aquamarina CBS 119918]|uniref:DUF7587 domain-containing protein n=1 Tax=Exophiala aquamarina CBS 119918 TaxID=1182545 RepID=A0A072NYV5_9EURO|nr:uncharacterized protein A1O9_11440 [Exophiala aquamarina CBS 119918]KEF52597.1 hypothetical protein A1O9_11440 [Exophiala aquamarina CBS 119918]